MPELACPSCQSPLTSAAKFCSECGEKVASVPRSLSRQPGERRQVSILFADITGYTRLSSQIDPEELHALLSRYFERVDGVVQAFGGNVDKHIGDAVMGVFGVPISHGNDAERAVRAAMAIHESMTALSDELGRTVSVHIGIASGEVLAAATGSDVHSEYTVLGDAVNLASRLDGLAAGGETVISAGVERATRGIFELEPRGEVPVKGLGEPVRVFAVRGLAQDRAQLPPLVGREAELSVVERLLDRASGQRSGTLLVLRGEPGIGKTRLTAEMRRQAEVRGFSIHTALVLDFGAGQGQDAVHALVRSLLDVPLESAVSERQAALARARHTGLLLASEEACAADLLEVPPPAALLGQFGALAEDMRRAVRRALVTDLVVRVAARRPLLAVIEDVHWAEPETLDYLAAVAQKVHREPIVVIATSRLEQDPLKGRWREWASPTEVEVLDLRALDAVAAKRLAERHAHVDPSRLEACIQRAGGNPLFLEQLLASDTDTQLPDSLQSLVQARADRLEPKDKSALQAASVVGQRFSLEVVRHLMQSPDYVPDALVERGLIQPYGDVWLFAHALVRDGVYSALLRQARRELHRRAATWFGTSDPVLRAEHLDRADDAAAAGAYLAAAQARIEAFDFDEADRLIARGREVAKSGRDAHDLARLSGDLCLYRSRGPEAKEAFERAAREAPTSLDRCRALIGQADAYRMMEMAPEGHAALDEATLLLDEAGMDAERSRIHRIRGSFLFSVAKDSRGEQELALEHAVRSGDAELQARALSCLADAHYIAGKVRLAHDTFVRCSDLCRSKGLLRVEIYQTYMIGLTRGYLGDLRGGLAMTEAGIEQALLTGHRRAEMLARETTALLRNMTGAHLRAISDFESALQVARENASQIFQAVLHNGLAEAYLGLGRLEEASAALERAEAFFSSAGSWFGAPLVVALRAQLATHDAEAAEMLAQAAQGLEGPRGLTAMMLYLRAAEVCLDRGMFAEAAHYAAQAPGAAEGAVLFERQAAAVLLLAELGLERPTDEQRERLTEAALELSRIGTQPYVLRLERALARA